MGCPKLNTDFFFCLMLKKPREDELHCLPFCKLLNILKSLVNFYINQQTADPL